MPDDHDLLHSVVLDLHMLDRRLSMRLKKRDFPLIRVREHLETGPVVLVTSRHERRSNIMTMGWHTMMEFKPALFGCYIWDGNRSFDAIRKSRECVINIPTADLLGQVIAIGNSHADDGDKFGTTGLTAGKARRVKAPLIDECYANFECHLFDDRMVKKYSFFIWEIVKAHVAKVDAPRTLHYRGQGTFIRRVQSLIARSGSNLRTFKAASM